MTIRGSVRGVLVRAGINWVEITELAVRAPTADVYVVHTVSTLDGQSGLGGSEAGRPAAVISTVMR